MKVKEIGSDKFLAFLQYNEYEDLESIMWIEEEMDKGDLVMMTDPSGVRYVYEVDSCVKGLSMIEILVKDGTE